MASVILDREITAITSPLEQPGASSPAKVWAAGPINVLERDKTGFFCSGQCPGGVILKTFDAITAMRDECRILVGGFHSPMEWECLGILLRGRQPVIWVPARGIVGMHLKPELQSAFAAGRLLILSPFDPKQRRITADLAEDRNRFVASLADRAFVAHAAPGSKTLALSDELRSLGKPVLTVDDPANVHLVAKLQIEAAEVPDRIPRRPVSPAISQSLGCNKDRRQRLQFC